MASANFSQPDSFSQSTAGQGDSKKRSSRACDQCRRTKSKCRKPTDPNRPCSNCVVAGLTCTYQGPSYKRGPPKGYINAIEQRLHQVEAILGVIVSSNDMWSQGIIAGLKRDEIAREIINRVDSGPYGSTSRGDIGPSRQTDFSSAVQHLEDSRDRQDMRASRESRLNREIVSSSQDVLPAPTPEWLERLSEILEESVSQALSTPSDKVESSPEDRTGTSFATRDVFSASDAEEKLEDEEAIGSLSVDEHDEIRYHAELSGMPLLDKLTDNPSARNSSGIWRLPMARTWPYAPMNLAELDDNEDNIPVQLPPVEHQDLLIELYFTYIHPDLPVLHKPTFMGQYATSEETNNLTFSPVSIMMEFRFSARSTQKLSKLLLLSIFTAASRLNPNELPPPRPGQMWEAGCIYLASARRLLNAKIHHSSLSTCQALVILAYREFGLGSLEQSYIYMGMAIRTAQDLGLHRAADQWQRFGVDIFSPAQKQERKHVWWSCAIADKYISCSMGRPITISERNYDTELPQDRMSEPPYEMMEEEIEIWQPHPAIRPAGPHRAMLSHTLSSFTASASLSIIFERIVENIYAVRQKTWEKRLKLLIRLEKELNDWVFGLPAHLHYDLSTRRPVPPHVLVLHIQHSAAVILLHRRLNAASEHGINTAKEFELCQEAADKITGIVLVLRDMFSLKATSAFLPSYLMSAGIVHVAALAMNHNAAHAAVALQDTLSCLKDMEYIWPGAARDWELLNSTKMRFEERPAPGAEISSRFPPANDVAGAYTTEQNDKDASMHLMAHLLGLEIPGVANPTVPASTWSRGMPSAYASPEGSASGRLGLPGAQPEYGGTSSGGGPRSAGAGPGLHERMQAYRRTSPAFDGYDFQSFTNADPSY
ncbi:hypothetical protein M0805_003766 [Coniferiporia weirii]|nr:hypothetical protein M0805_003766 [Coniferiporia weirii]